MLWLITDLNPECSVECKPSPMCLSDQPGRLVKRVSLQRRYSHDQHFKVTFQIFYTIQKCIKLVALYLKISSFECMLFTSHLLSSRVRKFTRTLTPWIATACIVSMATGVRMAVLIDNSRESSAIRCFTFSTWHFNGYLNSFSESGEIMKSKAT